MDSDHKTSKPDQSYTAHSGWLHQRRKIQLRRRKLPTVRLGERKPRRGRHFLLRLFRRARLRWLKLNYLRILKKLKQYYRSLIRDIIDGSATAEAVQQRILMETSFAVPVLGVSFNSFPNAYPV
ncbi:hypothetical protein NMG60_11002375 [Bertholletia excelsa]